MVTHADRQQLDFGPVLLVYMDAPSLPPEQRAERFKDQVAKKHEERFATNRDLFDRLKRTGSKERLFDPQVIDPTTGEVIWNAGDIDGMIHLKS